MTDFSHLQKHEVRGDQTAEYEIPILVDDAYPTLIVAPATEANKPLFNKLVARAGRKQRIVQAGAVSASMVAQNREEDIDLYAKYVVKGWRNVTDADGDDVAFSPEACAEFLKALPTWAFDEIRAFCSAAQNFTDIIDTEPVVKNLSAD